MKGFVAGGAGVAVRVAGDGADDEPERVLGRRFAAGGISEEEYRQRLEVLRSCQPAGTSSPA